ncbi:MAG TPA: GNAT family N-acetyltransferase [Methanoregulaceae archaeon]|nr:GNAT family N-acetyltransferase [Methanoregulaceae archaeon]
MSGTISKEIIFSSPIVTRELTPAEFPLAAVVWYHYHQQTGDPATDRIFGAFIDDTLAAVARCRRHKDGLEIDGVYTLEEYRGHGLARLVVQALVNACGHEMLFLHSTLDLIGFYRTFGFLPIPERDLPPTIKERLAFCLGEMTGCNACPMRRMPGV